MVSVRKICVVTGTRAEYGLLCWLMKAIERDVSLELQVLVTGMHLAPEFGSTYRAIEEDGFRIDAKVEMLLASDTPVGTAKSVGVGTLGFADAIHRLRPDLLVVLGDRFEILAAVQVAMLLRIPVAHIHGGESSEGAYDESIRHAITKIAQLHLVAAEPYRKRVIQLGEMPERVYNVGALGLEYLEHVDWIERKALEADLQLPLEKPLFLVTYHAATLAEGDSSLVLDEILKALEEFPDATVVFTYPNADAGGRRMIERIENHVASGSLRTKAFPSLGQRRYLSLMRLADVVMGNSSSGLTEAPALKKATVNIGDRQRGRLKAASVIDVPGSSGAIADGIRTALSPEFQDRLPSTISLYGGGDVSAKIVAVLKTTLPSMSKTFFDIAHEF